MYAHPKNAILSQYQVEPPISSLREDMNLSHRRRRRRVALALIPIVLLIILYGALPLAAQTPLLRHKHWEGKIGKLDVWIGDPVDLDDGVTPFFLFDHGPGWMFVRTAVPLNELEHYWYTTISWGIK